MTRLKEFLCASAFICLSSAAQDPMDSAAVHHDSIHLEAVTIDAFLYSGNLMTIPGSVSVLRNEDLHLSETNLAGIINTLPGVAMQTGTYTTNRIVIRGMGSRTPYNTNRIRSYLNGIPLTTADGVSTPEEIDLGGLGRMEIIKGPASALFGSGLGGSINLYTPTPPEKEHFSAGAQYGSFNTAKLNLMGGLVKNKTGLWGNIGHMQSDGYRENNNYRRTSLLATLNVNIPGWPVKTTVLLMSVDAGIPSSLDKVMFENSPQSAAPNWKAIAGYKKYNKAVGGIEISKRFRDNITNSFTLFGRLSDNYEKRPFNNLDDRSLSAGFRNKLNIQYGRADLAAGAELVSERYDWELNKDAELLNRNTENMFHLNLFSILYYRIGDNLNISAGGAVNYIRYRLTDLFSADGDQSGKRIFPLVVSPRAGINYSPGNMIAFYASAGHGFSLPSPDETLLPAGNVNPDIRHESGMQYEIGSRLNNLAKTLSLDVSLYLIELNNLLVTKRLAEDIFTGTNAGKTRHLGIEFQQRSIISNKDVFPGRLVTIMGYSSSLNKFIDFTDDGNVYDGNFLPGIPRHSASLQLKWDPVKLFEVAVHMQYSGMQYLNDANSLDYPGYFISGIRMGSNIKINKTGFEFYAGINNITDAHYASMLIVNALPAGNNGPRYYYPGLPRHFFAGLQIRL